MKEKTLELTNVLSDPTRYSIYEYLIEAEKPVTVKEVAKEGYSCKCCKTQLN